MPTAAWVLKQYDHVFKLIIGHLINFVIEEAIINTWLKQGLHFFL